MIRPAKTSDHNLLTEISFQSKNFWNYPDEYFDIWKKELIITKDYLKKNSVFVFADKEKITGYYSLVSLKNNLKVNENIIIHKGVWLEHLFIIPEKIKNGVGSKLMNHMVSHCLSNKIDKINILADPNSRGFYEKKGAKYISEYPSTINGRTTPFFEWSII